MKHLTIWHTNDIHSHLEHWPRIFAFLKGKKLAAQKKQEQALFFDIGDFIDRVHPLTEGTYGKANIDLLNQVPYDAVTIGNNEGLTLSHQHLDQLYENALFPVVCCNLYLDKKKTKRPSWLKPFVLQEVEDKKIALIGATAPFSEYYTALDWEISEPIAAIHEQIRHLPESVDAIVLLSHLGLPTDKEIAMTIPEIDVILGSHTHHLLENGEIIGNTLLAAAGRWGEYLGKVELVFAETGKIIAKTATTFKTADLPEPTDENNQIAGFFTKGKSQLSEKVVALPKKLEHNWFGDSQIADLFHVAACEWAKADSFLTNAGIYMTDLGPGTVTAFDIHQLLPHPLNLIVLTMNGLELEVLIQEIHRKQAELLHFPLKGFGFRGQVFGKIQLKRASFDQEKALALWDNERIAIDKTYRIVTHDTFVYAPFFPIIKEIKQKEVYAPELLRDILTWKLKAIYG
ncbi:bifunctional UDP-sugar hydrolase/5'-nucleotidase [Listeria sp. PSOL-1]|uniref:bifunctional metallophosphatase/5'-nucleotidase n=1 Tax=Listeria sp. PSOL-1 TaxID=1844999 RepID=UPI0013D004C4|nr:bifunctional UDP-sugar hydrolase/5'-nucleotidase [Listeria sp. PSOL-1]